MGGSEGKAESSGRSGASLRKRGRPLLFGILALTLTALYLLLPARNVMDAWAAGAVLLHIGLGIVLTLPVAIGLIRALRSGARGLWWIVMTCAVCAATGYWLFGRAAIGTSTAREAAVWWTHIAAGFAAILFFLLRRGTTSKFPVSEGHKAAGPVARDFSPSLSRLLLLLLSFPALLGAAAGLADYPAKAYYQELTATNPTQAANPLFPAGTRLAENSAPEAAARWKQQNAAYCGRGGCHPTAYQEWLASAHRHAASDPFYRRVKADFTARKGEDAARWCTGCHAPQSVLSRTSLPPSQTSSARTQPTAPLHSSQRVPDLPRSSAEDTPLSNRKGEMPSAVDCVACHATTGSVTHTGNGRFIMDVPQTYPFAGEVGGWKRGLHDFLLRVRPGPHQRAFLKPQWHRSAEFCGTCHRQSFGVPQNGFRLVRGADTYGEWQAGPFSGRSAQNAGNARSCQACHFPRNGTGHTAHSAPGANTALPALRGDTEHQAQIEQFVKQERITLDIFALRKEPTRSGQREKRAPEMWLAPLDAPQETVSLRSGDRVTLDIVVTNRGIGHSFPSGYADIRDAWLEVTLSDASGRVLLANGITATREEIPDDAHIYRTIPLDREGKPLRHHELDRMTTTAYRRVIPAGASDIARYVFTLPQPPSNRTFRIHARLRYRPLRPEFARWVLGEKSPALPMTTLAETTVEIEGERRKAKGESEGKGEPTPNTKNQKPKTKNQSPTPEQMALRFMNYGNGLIAPAGLPDRAAALRAFRQAQILAPKRPGPYIGMGRAYLTEPDFLAARVQFEKALALAPNHPAASHALGFVLGKQGEYERALHILAPLAKRFPQDVALHFDLGVTYFRLGRYAEASEAFRCALTTDPDYAPAHFQLKRCYQHLRRVPEARREEAIGKYLAEDEETPRLRETYLRNHPAERPATLPIPRHNLRSR